MPPTSFALAQVNIGRLLAPLDSEQLAGFVAALEPVNALADAAPGFVWRLTGDDGNDATSERFFGELDLLVNMSVWRDLESLSDFVFRGAHVEVMRQRRLWFAPMTELYAALWWVPIGALPTIADAEERVLHLRQHGPTPFAFTFRSPFPAPVHAPLVASTRQAAGSAERRESPESRETTRRVT